MQDRPVQDGPVHTWSPGRAVSAVLDPVLVPVGFAPGQYGAGGDDPPAPAQVVFCAAHDELSDRYPRLPQAGAQERDRGACIDLVVQVTADGSFDFLDLEAVPLRDTLRQVGLDADADAVAGVEGRPLLEGLPGVEAALRSLFATTA